MGIQLSYSALEKYKLCPAQYKLHYLDRIRSHKISSPLLFGGALDEALNVLLETKLDEPTERATDDLERLKSGFDQLFTYQMINKELEDVRTSHFVDYFASDFDRDILTEQDLTSLKTFINNAGYIKDPNNPSSGRPDVLDLFDEIQGYIKDGQELDSTDRSFYNYSCWLSLRRKGHLLLEHYKDEIMPKIKRVVSVQKKVTLPNDEGDEIIGYIDLEAELYDEDGVITLDNKTSSSKYKMTDINDKGQLLIYDEYTDNGKAGYIVLLKKIKYEVTVKCDSCEEKSSRRLKNCPVKGCDGKMHEHSKVPNVESQILVDNIDNDKKDLLFDKICGILSNIEKEEFPQNRDSCFQFGRKCIYYDYCRSNPVDPDITGLAKV